MKETVIKDDKVMVEQYNSLHCVPSAEELFPSDDSSEDCSELENLIPNLLRAVLAINWSNRWDWFFGVDVGIYYDTRKPAIIPDGFLVLGVQRVWGESEPEDLRCIYLLKQEKQVPPIVLEVIGYNYHQEHTRRRDLYASLGILYYAIYNPNRISKPTLEIYKLVEGEYLRQPENPVWLPEIGLGIGREIGTYQGITREWIYWYDESGKRLLTPEERAIAAEQRVEKLEEKLRSLGVDPDSIT